MNSVHFSQQTDRWFTPEWLYKKLDSQFHFDSDPALKDKVNWANDGLSTPWGKSTFCNPPYSDLERWISKGYREYQKGNLVVFLIPSRTDTKCWHNYVMKASEVWFIKGRITFEGAKAGAPFPSCIVIFDPAKKGNTQFRSLEQHGSFDFQDDFPFQEAQ